MSRITNLIFKNEKHYITSKFGWRRVINTGAGATNKFHNGTDYGTNGKKLPQYAIEDGVVLRAGTDKFGGRYAWIKYPRLNIKMLHYHLYSVNCKTGQSVGKGTLIGYTGMSGRATGIHLHLSIVDLTNGRYIDPELYIYHEAEMPKPMPTTGFFPKKGYFKAGDVSENVGRIALFLRKNFPAYTSKYALGNIYGKYIIRAIKEFQRRTGLVPDGMTGPKTLKMLRKYGFKY